MSNQDKVSTMKIRETTKAKIRGLKHTNESLDETLSRVLSELETYTL